MAESDRPVTRGEFTRAWDGVRLMARQVDETSKYAKALELRMKLMEAHLKELIGRMGEYEQAAGFTTKTDA